MHIHALAQPPALKEAIPIAHRVDARTCTWLSLLCNGMPTPTSNIEPRWASNLPPQPPHLNTPAADDEGGAPLMVIGVPPMIIGVPLMIMRVPLMIIRVSLTAIRVPLMVVGMPLMLFGGAS